MNSVKSLFNTILGFMYMESNDIGVTGCGFVDGVVAESVQGVHEEYIQQIRDYLSGELRVLSIPTDLQGTDFNMTVWNAVSQIPYGSTDTYAGIAKRLSGNANPRNVGQANGANPVALIIPCHRVIASDGNLTGYAWGIERKKRLLELEGAISQLSIF